MTLKAANTITNFYRLYKMRKMKFIQKYLYSKKIFASIIRTTTVKFISTVSDDDYNLMNLRTIEKDIDKIKQISSIILKRVESRKFDTKPIN